VPHESTTKVFTQPQPPPDSCVSSVLTASQCIGPIEPLVSQCSAKKLTMSTSMPWGGGWPELATPRLMSIGGHADHSKLTSLWEGKVKLRSNDASGGHMSIPGHEKLSLALGDAAGSNALYNNVTPNLSDTHGQGSNSLLALTNVNDHLVGGGAIFLQKNLLFERRVLAIQSRPFLREVITAWSSVQQRRLERQDATPVGAVTASGPSLRSLGFQSQLYRGHSKSMLV